MQIPGELSDAAAEALGAALKTNTTLTTLRLDGKVSDAAAEALGEALKTKTALAILQIRGMLSDAAAEALINDAYGGGGSEGVQAFLDRRTSVDGPGLGLKKRNSADEGVWDTVLQGRGSRSEGR